MSYTCQTAPNVTFTSREELHAHYKSEWHRYNLKRKVSSLPPVSLEEFEKRKAAAMALSAEQRRKAGAGSGTSHLKQDKAQNVAKKEKAKAKRALKLAKAQGMVPPTATLSNDALAKVQGNKKEDASDTPSTAGALPTPPAVNSDKDNEDDIVLSSDMDKEESSSIPDPKAEPGQWKEIAWTDEGEQIQKFVVNVKTCIFSKKKSETVASNIRHMQTHYGLFIPDVEYLVDPEGLIAYLTHKAVNGRTCLFCQRQFRTSEACIQHMIDSSHCKIKYDSEEDQMEFADFYDFTLSYPEDAEIGEGSTSGGSSKVEENDGWESASDDDEDMPNVDDADDVSDEDLFKGAQGEKLTKRTITVNEQGELLLLDGRIIGNRKFKRFYKQRYSDLNTSVDTVTINGVTRPKPSKMKAVVRRYPKIKQEQMLLGYTEGGVDAMALVPQSREHSGVVSLPRQEQRRMAAKEMRRFQNKLGNKILAKHFKFRDPYV